MKSVTKSRHKKSRPIPPSLKKAAVAAALAGGRILRRYFFARDFARGLRAQEKSGMQGLVTEADLRAEETIIRTLRKNAPAMDFLAEEGTHATPGKSGLPGRWIIDPLDGTTNFVHRFPMFCVSIAAEWEGELAVGVVYHPILKELYVAERGKGAQVNGQKLSVSQTRNAPESLLSTGFTYRKDHWLKKEMFAFEQMSKVARAVRRPGSAALDLAYTARGVFDGFWERRLAPWDVAAGILLVQEAGGKVTDFQNRAVSLDSREILATNGLLHRRLLQEFARSAKSA